MWPRTSDPIVGRPAAMKHHAAALTLTNGYPEEHAVFVELDFLVHTWTRSLYDGNATQ